MTFRPPAIIGHRGACGYAPENTLESIETAASMGVEWVELDVKLTKDRVPVIFHDDTLDRTTNGSGPVAQIMYEDLLQLEAGSWFGDSFAGIRIPTLEEACDILIRHNLGLNLEIKPCPGREIETAEVALDILSGIWDDHDRLIISSFQHVSLETARDMAGDWTRALLLDSVPENWRELADYLECAAVNPGLDIVTRDFVEDIIDTDRSVFVYTVNDPQDARRLKSWGVDGVFTDVPDVIAEALPRLH